MDVGRSLTLRNKKDVVITLCNNNIIGDSNNMTDLMRKLNIQKSTTTTTSNSGKTTLESQINKRAKEVVHEMLKREFPNNYKKIERSTLLKVDKNNKVSDKTPCIDYEGFCVLIPQNKTTITSGTNTHSIDSGFKVGVMQTYLQGAKSTICEFVKIDGKKVSSIIKK